MMFLAPWFLLGGLALGLPVWLHLLQRQNPTKRPFSSLMFFERRQQSSLRERRLRYLLLLAARLALYLLLALAFTKPIWEQPPRIALGGAPKLYMLMLDTSLSMNYGDRWQRAVAEAEAVIDSMDDVDSARILATGPKVRVITEVLTDKADLRAALQALRPTSSRNSYGEAVEAVRNLMPTESIPVEVHWISDFQQSALPGRFSDLALPTAASLVVHRVDDEEEAPNWTVESIKGSTRVFGGEPRLEATISGFGAEAARKAVSLEINGRLVETKVVDVPASGRASVVFENFDVPKGGSRGVVKLGSPDSLAEDDSRLVALDNSDPAPILFIYSNARRRDVLYYRSALDASVESMFEVVSASPAETQRMMPDRFAFVVISDVPRLPTLFADRLKNYVESGGSVLLVFGPKITLAGEAPLYDKQVGEARYTGREGERFQLVGDFDASHPMLRQIERFRGVKFFRYSRLWTNEEDDVIARLSDGSALLVEQPVGQGRLLILASPLDNVWNDLPVHPVFVPFVAESARYLSGMEEGGRQRTVDSAFELRERRNAGSSVQIFDPKGERVLSLTESLSEEIVALDQVGFYEVRRTGHTELVAVNPDPRESNLRPMDADTLELWRATGRDIDEPPPAEQGETAAKPPPLRIWRLFLFLLVLAALVESVLGNQHLKVRREVQI